MSFNDRQKRTDRVHVSNIDYSVRHQDLKELFTEVGDVAYVEMLKDEKTQRPSGCAIIRFNGTGLIDDTINKFNRYEYKGRKLVVKDPRDVIEGNRSNKRQRPDDFDADPQNRYGNTFGLSTKFLESLNITGPLNCRVFVANLPYEVEEDDVLAIFSLAGKVESVELVIADGKCKGFGFVEFEHPVEAVQAISMLHKQQFRDRNLTVQYTQKERRKDGPPRLPPGLKGLGMGLGSNGLPLKNIRRTMESGQQSFGAMPVNNAFENSSQLNLGLNMGMSNNNSLGFNSGANVLGSLNQSQSGVMNQSMFKDRFSSSQENKLIPSIVSGSQSLMGEPPSMIGSGYGDSQNNLRSGFDSQNNMQSRFDSQNRRSNFNSQSNMRSDFDSQSNMRSNFDSQSNMRSGYNSQNTSRSDYGSNNNTRSSFDSQSNMGGSRGSQSLMGPRPSSMLGSSSSRSQDMGSSVSSLMSTTNAIQVANLPFDYNWKSLNDLCQAFGDVSFAKMTGNGIGIVCFDSKAAAKRAVDMLSNQHFEGKILEARMG